MRRAVALCLLVCASGISFEAGAEARWISDSDAVAADAAAKSVSLQFRRELTLNAKPQSFRVRVSADNRFVLYVNNRRVGAGPARGNLKHWRYESLDLAPLCKTRWRSPCRRASRTGSRGKGRHGI
jgi:alpha-L-rhamnosidase